MPVRSSAGPVAGRLVVLWLLVTALVIAAPLVTPRGVVRELPPSTSDVTLFARRPAGAVLAIDVGWDAPAGRDGWIILEGARARGASDAMSWRRHLHSGWNVVTWDLTHFPADEEVRLRLVSPADAAWRISAPRVDERYRLRHLVPLRGLLLAVVLAAALAIAQSVRALVALRGRTTLVWWLAVIAIAAGGLVLRLRTLDLQSFWFDEVLTAIGAHDLAWVLHTPEIFRHPPLHYLFAWALGGGGPEEWWLRLPSCLAGAATIVALAALGRAVFGPITGLVAALVLALSRFHVELSQLARPYALFLLLTVASLTALVRAVERDRARDWLWLSALVTLNLYTHYLATQVLALEAIFCVVLLVRARRRGTLSALLSFAGIGVLLLPWASVLTRLGDAQLRRGDVSAAAFGELVLTVFVPQFLGPGVGATIGLTFIAIAVWAVRRRVEPMALALLWLAVPPVVFWMAQPAHFIAGRHLAFTLPIVMLLVAHGIVVTAASTTRAARALGLRHAPARRLIATVAASILLVAWSAPAAEALRHYYEGRRGIDWKTVVAVLDRAVRDGDRVAATDGALYPLRHYWRLRIDDIESAGFPGAPVRDGARWWIVAHNGWDRPSQLAAWLQAHAVEVGEIPVSWSVPGVTLYRLRR